MNFYVVKNRNNIVSDENNVYLIIDNWNDWFKYTTQFYLLAFNEVSELIEIGSVKIGQVGMESGSPDIPIAFQRLGENFFSLGQDVHYYENLKALKDEKRQEIFKSLNDMSYNIEIYYAHKNENVISVSLMRDITEKELLWQFKRVAHGGAMLTQYDFTYTSKKSGYMQPIELSFHVEPESMPPTNIHVLIGRNGVGKTHLLNDMNNALIFPESEEYGSFSLKDNWGNIDKDMFANVIFVSFSAFDDCHLINNSKDHGYSYIGLSYKNGKEILTKSPEMLAKEFQESLNNCYSERKIKRWQAAIEVLQSDPIFFESQIESIFDEVEKEDFSNKAKQIFKRLSTGHKIVLLTITKLIETVEEKTIVFMDEPETYLHPPLVASFIRALSELLIYRNGVCIMATHSPVVLQEVPSNCVWKLRRNGRYLNAERMKMESFGENIGILIADIFQLEVTNSGFHKLIEDAVNRFDNYEAIEIYFNNQLGMEAKAIIRSLMLSKNTEVE